MTNETYKTEHGSKTIRCKTNGIKLSTYEYILNSNSQVIKRTSSWKHFWSVNLYNYTNELKQSEVRIHKRSTYVDEYNYEFY